MKVFRTLGISVVAGAATLAATSVPAQAQVSLQDVLNAARAESAAVAEQNREREARFLAERNTQRQKLAQIEAQVNQATAESNRLDGLFEANFEQINQLKADLQEKQGEFGELFGAARSAAGDLATQLEASIISAQYPGRTAALQETAQSETLPSVEELQELYFTMLQEMTAQSEVASFPASVFEAGGQPADADVTRIGPFVAFSGGKYLVYQSDYDGLAFLSRQPAGAAGAVEAARRVANYNGDGYVRGVIDPSLGTILGLTVQRPTLAETIAQGRTVGYVILAILAFGALLGIYKWVTLFMTGGAVRGQMRKKKASKGNPLGRIMQAYESNTSADVETLALKLDDAVLKEVPKLEGGLNLIKVLAAVAPLLGLLGTVIGMIRTFQAITLYGTGDPQLMASGISEALVTTVLGLVAAIPLLLIHAFASGAARNVSQILEEQSAGMIAEHAESRG